MTEKTYVLIPGEWDYKRKDINEIIEKYYKQGIFSPCCIEEIKGWCGALPYWFNEKSALAHLKRMKKEYPYVAFGLYESNGTWEKMELIKEL